MTASRGSRWTVAFGVAGLLAIVGYYAVPDSVQGFVYDLLGLACVVAMAVRARSLGKPKSGPWWLGALGIACWVVGDVLSEFIDYGDSGLSSYLTVADALYLVGYPVLAAALVRARRLRTTTPDRGATFEALMLTVAAMLPMYAFWISPALASTTAGALEVAVVLAYPVMDLMLLAAGMRLALGALGWNLAGALLGAGLVLNVIVDGAYNVQVLNGTYVPPSPLDAGWLLAYVGWGAAALHPSSARLMDPRPSDPAAMLRLRTVFLSLLFASPLFVIAVSYGQGHGLDAVAVLTALAAITAVMIARLREIARSGDRRWRADALVYGMGVVVVLLAIAITNARAASERRTDAALALSAAQVSVERLGAEAGSTASVRRELEAVRKALPAADRGLLAADRAPEQIRRDLATATARYRRSAATTASAERASTVVLVTLGALILIALLRRFGTARRTADRAQERSLAMAESESRFRAMVAGSQDILTLIDADTRIVGHPETVERVLGTPEGSLLGSRMTEFLDRADALRTFNLLRRLSASPGAAETIDWCLQGADGREMTVEARIVNHLDDPRLEAFVLNVRDVTARADLERELEHRAFHDHLTGLANRALLEDRLRHAFSRSARSLAVHAVVVLDLQDFKSVNDSLGHLAGDTLLVEVAKRLRMSMRSNDTLARLGGDEFAVLLEDISSAEQALRAARRLLDGIVDSYEIAGHAVSVSGSAGVAVSDASGALTVEEAATDELRKADVAMYAAKSMGGGTVELYAPEMHEAVTNRLELRGELRRGLENDEFRVHYQPIIAFSGQEVVGFEALVRWQHPERGLVPPVEFIPVAEQTGLIIEIGRFVLREATRQLAEWDAAGHGPYYMAVNVAGIQLQRPQMVDEVAEALSDAGIAPERLLLELTESALIQDSEGNERRLMALRELGVRLAIDDFGTGYSSLSYLQRFSVDVLKIDKQFVDPVGAGRATPLVEAIINMGRALGVAIVAEGIESAEQMTALEERGCHHGQGYLFSRPLPADEIVIGQADRKPRRTSA